MLVAVCVMAAASADTRRLPARTAEDGKVIYEARCAACHQLNGEGIPGVFPPLAGAEWVGEEKGRLIRIVLHGMTGETTVRGITYNGAMPSWGDVLTDSDIALVLSFVRSSWGNDAPAVQAGDVQSVRRATADRTAPWTDAELSNVKNLVVPDHTQSETDVNTPSTDQ